MGHHYKIMYCHKSVAILILPYMLQECKTPKTNQLYMWISWSFNDTCYLLNNDFRWYACGRLPWRPTYGVPLPVAQCHIPNARWEIHQEPRDLSLSGKGSLHGISRKIHEHFSSRPPTSTDRPLPIDTDRPLPDRSLYFGPKTNAIQLFLLPKPTTSSNRTVWSRSNGRPI